MQCCADFILNSNFVSLVEIDDIMNDVFLFFLRLYHFIDCICSMSFSSKVTDVMVISRLEK